MSTNRASSGRRESQEDVEAHEMIEKALFTAPPSRSMSSYVIQAITYLWLAYIVYQLLKWLFSIELTNDMQSIVGKASQADKNAQCSDRQYSSTKLADVAGIDDMKQEVVDIIGQIKAPAKFAKYGARPLRGVLLTSSPGQGKTLLARAIAGECGLPFLSMSGSEFINKYAGTGASNVRALFEKARIQAPAIIFIDEIDSIAGNRADSSEYPERVQTLNQLLVAMDGFAEYSLEKQVFVIGATNRPDVLDPAILRSGRLDRHLTIRKPNRKARAQIFLVYLRKLLLDPDLVTEATMDQLADKLALFTPGFTGAKISAVCNEAAILAARREAVGVTWKDFEAGIKITAEMYDGA